MRLIAEGAHPDEMHPPVQPLAQLAVLQRRDRQQRVVLLPAGVGGLPTPRGVLRAAYAASGSARSDGRTSDAPTAAARQPTMTASDTHVGMCQTSLSSILTPTNARMTARP
jgi:hypothetical protein